MTSAEITHKTLARLFEAIDHSELPAVRQDLLTMVEHEPFKSMYRHLERLAEEAGTPRHLNGWELEAVHVHETFDLLVETENWADVDVFDPKHQDLLDFSALLNVCRARKKASPGDHRRLLEIEHKLIAAAAKQQTLEDREKQLDLELRETLLRLLQPCTDLRTPARLIDLLEMLTGNLRRLPLNSPETLTEAG